MPVADETDFELVKYERDRDHELALNEFTHNLEVEQLKLLILLNGAAATALLTFAEHRAARAAWLMIPVLVWLVGLFLGARATLRMRKAQSGYAKFYRHRRHATEFLRLAGRRRLPLGIAPRDLWALARRARRDPALRAAIRKRQLAALHDAVAAIVIDEARAESDRIDALSRFSLWAFLLGAAAAAAVIALVPMPPAAETGGAAKATAARAEVLSSAPGRPAPGAQSAAASGSPLTGGGTGLGAIQR